MKVSLCTVPVEPEYDDFAPKVSNREVLSPSRRSEGQIPIMPKIAIVSLIKWMEKHGWGPESYDYYDIDMELPTDERLAQYFREYNPTVVGLSAVVSTCYYQTRRISRILRETCPDAWIVLGGSLTASANLVLHKTAVDLCIVGDGEIPWVEFLEYVKRHGRERNYEALAKIRGLAYLTADGALQATGYGVGTPAEDQPYPDYDILRLGLKDRPEDLMNYFRPALPITEFATDPRSYESHRRPMAGSLWTTKGCVARCTFCQRSTKGYRVGSVDALDAHLDMLKSRFDVGFIHVLDENFASDIRYTYELCDVFKKHDMLWMASGVRVSSMKREYIAHFKVHGCTGLKFGVETGSQKIMNVMEKNFTVERVVETLTHCAELDITSPLAVMVGMPGETNETVLATGKFLGKVAHVQGVEPKKQGISIFYALPMTGTPLYRYGQQVGLFGKSPDEEEKYLLSVSGTGASKVNYINLNGAPLRDVIFWDWLVRLEASRVFFELDRERPIDTERFMYKAVTDAPYERAPRAPLTIREVVTRMRAGARTGLRSRIFYAVDNFLERHVVFNPRVHRLPRWVVYPVVRNLTYAQYLGQKLAARLTGREFNIFKPRPRVAPLDLAPHPVRVEIKTSLRTIVKQREAADSHVRSVTEHNQDVLAIGL
jgi:radical SAM superfamily enzyme YgiQ (UPF0313 family)